MGILAVIFATARRSIPAILYEASAVDGAGPFRQFRSITMPVMGPVIFFAVMLATVSALQAYSQVFLLTGGGPAGATEVAGLYVYNYAFRFLRIGHAMAAAWVLILVSAGVTASMFLSARSRVSYENSDS